MAGKLHLIGLGPTVVPFVIAATVNCRRIAAMCVTEGLAIQVPNGAISVELFLGLDLLDCKYQSYSVP